MGWWPMHIPTGGIRWNDGGVTAHFTTSALDKDDLAWGDTPADIVDGFIDDKISELFAEINKVFQEEMGREMLAVEFLGGLAFSFSQIGDPDLGGVAQSKEYRLEVRVVPRTEHDWRSAEESGRVDGATPFT